MYRIRRMTESDIKEVRETATASWHATYEGIIPREVQDRFLSAAYSDGMLARRLGQSVFLVAEQEERIVGFANFTPVDPDGVSELAAIYLMPDAQGAGIGTALLEQGIGMLEGVQTIEVTVEKENSSGMQFYVGKGFRMTDVFEEDFDGHLLYSVRMRKMIGK